MNDREHSVPNGRPGGPSQRVYSLLAAVGLVAPTITFLIAVSGLSSQAKIYGLAATSAVYFYICFWSYRQLRSEMALERTAESEEVSNRDLTEKLYALEEANEFFGTSLKPADTFRLVASRIRDIYPFTTSVFFLVDPSGTRLTAQESEGKNHEYFRGCEIEKGRGLAGLAALSGEVEFSRDMRPDIEVLPPAALKGLRSTTVIPLFYEMQTFGVIQLFSESKLEDSERSRSTLRSVGERVGSLLRGSIAFEKSLSNALTDPLTSLPNERAFFMILENQLAESIRFRDERPLAVVTFDIKGFDDGGHAVEDGERLLNFVATTVRGQLRKMDFIARSISDEFLLILPTASEEKASEIVERIRTAFAQTPFTTSDERELKIWLNFGTACFWKDGETANQLLQTARLRKQQAKSQDPDKVLWFPKEYVN